MLRVRKEMKAVAMRGMSAECLMKKPAHEETTRNIDGKVYTITVKPADSTWKIAKRYHVSQDLLKAYNGMGEDATIFVGQKVNIPIVGTRGWDLWNGRKVQTGPKSLRKAVQDE